MQFTVNSYSDNQLKAAGHHRILIFHSYQESLLWDKDINQGIEKVFRSSGLNYGLYYEYMDSKRSNTIEYFQELAHFYRYKYKDNSFDLIIASDNNALLFLEEYGREIFDSTPVIFTGVNGFEDDMLDGYDNITGVAEEPSYRETIDIALKLHPDKEELIVYGDQTTTYHINKAQLKKIIPEYQDKITFSFRDHLRLSEIVEDLKGVGDDSIVLLISSIIDDQGKTLSFSRIASLLSESNTAVPIYGLWDFYLGYGVVGGKVVSGEKMGELAANMAVKYLQGTAIDDIEVIRESPNPYVFDYKKLVNFSINIKKLPADSIIINQPEGNLIIPRQYVFSTLMLLVFLLFFAIYLIHTNTKIRNTRSEVKAEKMFSERIINTAEAAIVVLDTEGRVKLFNRFCEELSLYKKDEVLGKDAFDLFFTHGSREHHRQNLSDMLGNGVTQWRTETTIVDKNGEHHFVSWQNSFIKNPEGKIEGVLSIGIDLTKQNQIEENLQYKLYHDELTLLPNMKFIREKLTISVEEAVDEETSLAIMMFDLDRFRLVNDIYGHQFGDQLLIKVSERLTSLIGDRATIARIGGDDYIILLTGVEEVPEVVTIAEDILKEIKKPFNIDDEEILIQASIGIAIYPGDGGNEDRLIKAADSAMYRAKEMGNGSYHLYNDDINIRNTERHFLEKNIVYALEDKQFEVYYQPIVEVNTGEIVGAEALLRWNHPERGIISPGKFIPIAEENGSIIEIGYYVIREACKQFARWYKMGCDLGMLSINLSPRQFGQDYLLEEIEAILSDCNFPADKLVLEITESTAIINPSQTSRTLHEMRSRNIRFFLDDFGTGFSSLNYLTRFPVHGLKIDRSFINLLENGGENHSVVAAIIAMAHQLGIKVIAEGVETAEQLQFIKDHKCEFTQGYYCYRPMPVKDLEEILFENRGDRE